MRANEMKSRWGAAIAGTLGAGALLVTVGCGATRDLAAGNTAQMPTANQAGAPVLVSCEPHQRALVRPAVVNGAAVSQVECVTAAMTDAYASGAIAQPVANTALPGYRVASAPRRVVYDELGDTQIVPVASRSTVRPVRTRQVVYDERPVRRNRSVKKSAIIIGSSAGVGAGVGAAMGGKKGALIGAAIGGGSAAIWDQVTRRNN